MSEQKPSRNFRPPPDKPASHTGWCWRNKDGTIGIEISDVFLAPINLIGVKEGEWYFLRGWRGKPPDEIAIPWLDNGEETTA